jgi:large subunit ribosomal protein L23
MHTEASTIIKRPLITEKSTWESADRHRYSFEVDPRATKTQIKAAIAALYNVRVEKVSTQNRKGRAKRTRYGEINVGHYKRATVQLHPDDKIELF